MNEEEAIERLKYIDMQYDCNNYYSRYDLDCIETVLNLLEKKDKIIDEIIGFLATRTWATCPNEDCGTNLDCEKRCSNDDNIYEECWKMYFERKVENGN